MTATRKISTEDSVVDRNSLLKVLWVIEEESIIPEDPIVTFDPSNGRWAIHSGEMADHCLSDGIRLVTTNPTAWIVHTFGDEDGEVYLDYAVDERSDDWLLDHATGK